MRATSLVGLRVLVGIDALEKGPVDSPRIKQGANPIVRKAHESECCSLHPFDQIIHGLCSGIREMSNVPRQDLILPSVKGSSKRLDLSRIIGKSHVGRDLHQPFFGCSNVVQLI